MEDALEHDEDREDLTLASLSLNPEDEPVLGPLGQRLVILLIVVLAILLIGATVWLIGYLAYTTPPVPGSS